MRSTGRQHSQGFILVTVLFLLAVIAVMAVVMSTTSSVQNLTTVYSLQQARAFFAARSGLEYGIQRAVSVGECLAGPSAITLPGISFNVTTMCTSVTGINEAGNISNVYTISATAVSGTYGNVGYVTRSVRAMVNS